MSIEFLTLDQIREEYPLIARGALYRAIDEGQLTALKVGKSYLVQRIWLDAWLLRNTVNPEASTEQGVK